MFASGKLDAATAPSHGTLGRGPRCLVERAGTIGRRSLKKFTLLAATAMLSACGGGDTQAPPADTSTTDTTMQTPAPAAAAATPTDAAGYVPQAGAGDLWELDSSQALRAHSPRDDMQAFAPMLIDNHCESQPNVKSGAHAAPHTLPPP